MHGSTLRPLRRFAGPGGPTGCASAVLLLTSVYLVIGVLAFVAWGITGNVRLVEAFFRAPAALLLIGLAGVELWLCGRVVQHFSEGEPLRTAWLLIGLSSFCHFIGAIFSQLLSLDDRINPLANMSQWSEAKAFAFRQIGLILGGAIRYALLAAGLHKALIVYRQAGFPGRLKVHDWLLLSTIASYIVAEFGTLWAALKAGKHPSIFEVAGWPVDPLLLFLVAEALLLHRSAQLMGPGWISRCWQSYAIAVFLVFLGDLGTWLTNYGLLPWPWNSVVWYVWLPAGCTFALAPAYQLETIFQAMFVRNQGESPQPTI